MKYGVMTEEEFHESVSRVCKYHKFCFSCPLLSRVCCKMRDVDWDMEEVE